MDQPIIGRDRPWLRRVVQGWLNYHAVPSNSHRLGRVVDEVSRHWLRCIRRRSQQGKSGMRECFTYGSARGGRQRRFLPQYSKTMTIKRKRLASASFQNASNACYIQLSGTDAFPDVSVTYYEDGSTELAPGSENSMRGWKQSDG